MNETISRGCTLGADERLISRLLNEDDESLKSLSLNTFKEGLQSVLRIGSAHNKGGPPNINIVQISHFSNSLNWNSGLHSFISIANQKSVRYSFSKSYFTNTEFQNVNKAFVYITDCNPSLKENLRNKELLHTNLFFKKVQEIDDFWLFSFFLSISYCILFLLAYVPCLFWIFFSRVLKKGIIL